MKPDDPRIGVRLDPTKVTVGQEIVVRMAQDGRHYEAKVLELYKVWKHGTHSSTGRVGARVMFHADPVRGLFVNSKHGWPEYEELYAFNGKQDW